MLVCSGCASEAKFKCPVCLNEGLDYMFCSQECFKQNWSSHKLCHSIWPGYPYSGKLRPHYPLTPKRQIKEGIQKPDYWQTGEPLNIPFKIPILTKDEIQKMRKTCQMARLVLETGLAAIKVGATSDDVDKVVHEKCMELGCYPSPLNYRGFPKSCCVSVNEVICHGIPDQRRFKSTDLVNLDVTIYYDGFHGDLNSTVCLEKCDETGKRLSECARKCLDEAIKICKPGTPYREIGNVCQKVANEYKFSVVRTFCGHGIGKTFHCPPNVSHYGNNRSVGFMKEGHVFTIEPMINEGTWRDQLWPDDWTATTEDGMRSAQFEETLLITKDGCEILTKKDGINQLEC